MTLLWCGRNKIDPNHENSVPCGSLLHFLVLDRFGGLIIEVPALFSVCNQKKMSVQIQHETEVLNPIYMEPNMTARAKKTKRQKFWIFILHCLMKHDGVDRIFPFAKRNISEAAVWKMVNTWSKKSLCNPLSKIGIFDFLISWIFGEKKQRKKQKVDFWSILAIFISLPMLI